MSTAYNEQQFKSLKEKIFGKPKCATIKIMGADAKLTLEASRSDDNVGRCYYRLSSHAHDASTNSPAFHPKHAVEYRDGYLEDMLKQIHTDVMDNFKENKRYLKDNHKTLNLISDLYSMVDTTSLATITLVPEHVDEKINANVTTRRNAIFDLVKTTEQEKIMALPTLPPFNSNVLDDLESIRLKTKDAEADDWNTPIRISTGEKREGRCKLKTIDVRIDLDLQINQNDIKAVEKVKTILKMMDEVIKSQEVDSPTV